MVCVQAGNVNTGAVDPVGEICERAHASGAWVHVDGAFGLWAKASPSLAPLVAGVEQADSWATDAHKWLNVPYDSGLAFVRQSEFLGRAMTLHGGLHPQGGAARSGTIHARAFEARSRSGDLGGPAFAGKERPGGHDRGHLRPRPPFCRRPAVGGL